jgi:hypothetical protein
MESLYSLSVLVLLLFTSVGQICGSEVNNGNNHLSVEGNMKSGKSSNIVTSLFSVYRKNVLTNFG